jgi:hypothetical protein
MHEFLGKGWGKTLVNEPGKVNECGWNTEKDSQHQGYLQQEQYRAEGELQEFDKHHNVFQLIGVNGEV